MTTVSSNDSRENRTARFFDAYSGDFDAIYGNDNRAIDRIVNRLFRQCMVIRYQKTLAGCSPIVGRSVLDIGCGPGHYSVALARAGARRVTGLDFADAMLTIARQRAEAAGVADRCSFELADFLTCRLPDTYDYGILMGLMDYIRDPEPIVDRVVEMVRGRAFFSFPADGGVLAWQRKVRYRKRCELFMYTEAGVHRLLSRTGRPFSVERIGRDFFATVELSRSA